MKFIEIEENLNTIISLIENAEKSIVIVSPFNDFSGWDNLRSAIDKATERGIIVNYYVREGEGFNGIEGLKVNLFEVPKLHAKMFYSEKEALISSGNLTSGSDINWVCRLDTQEEVEELYEFYEEKIKSVARLFNV